jgi:hypothetical protein
MCSVRWILRGENKKILEKIKITKNTNNNSNRLHAVTLNITCLMSVKMGEEDLGRNINDRFCLNLDFRL